MKAIVLKQHNTIDNLEYVTDFPDPITTADHAVIRIRTASFNYHNIFTVRGMPNIKIPLPMIIDLDMTGKIIEIGPGMNGWKKDNHVLMNPLNRSQGLIREMMHDELAEKCLIAEHQLIRMPDKVSFEAAAALPIAYGTAHRILITHQTVKAEEKVLMLGANDSINTDCMILTKLLGTEMITYANSTDKLRHLQELDTNHMINYRETDFSKWIVEKFGKPQRRNHNNDIDIMINFTDNDT